MKNEDKIIELLSEQIQRQDRQEELLKRVVTAVDGLATVMDKKLEMVNDHEKRIIRLEDKFIK